MQSKICLVSIIVICFILGGCNENKQYKDVVQEANGQEEVGIIDKVAEQPLYLKNTEEKEYIAEDYGEIQAYGSEFYYVEETKGFYYNMEMFYLNSDFISSMNDTLEEFYDGYVKQYQESEDWHIEQGKQEMPEGKVPYSELLFLGIQYVNNDYISLLFNDVTYMGGAHPYSMFDAITIDRCTGEEVTASQILEESDKDILEKVSDLMGLDRQAKWTDIDFYLQEDTIVFFYRMPGYWDDVTLGR